MISQSDLFKLFRMISRCVINCDECALRFYVCSIFVDRVFVLFIFHHGVHWTYKCFAYVAPRGWIWVRRGLCGFGDIRGSVGRYDPWGIKATGFAVTTKINHYAAVTSSGHKLYFVFHNKSSCQVPRDLKSLGNFRGLGAFFWFFASIVRE